MEDTPLSGNEASAFWQSMEWQPAIRTGMEAEGVQFSGEYDFVETEMAWLLNHTVAPADDAVRCGQCHSRNGILADVSGSYIPGRDYSAVVDWLGGLLVVGTLAGVLFHGGLRFVAAQRRENWDTPSDERNEEE
jgi:hypothetical protein